MRPASKRNPRALELARLLIAELDAPYQARLTGELANPVYVTSPADVAAYLAPMMGELEQEELWVVLLNTRNRVVSAHMVYRGTINTCQVRLADIFKPAIRENAAALVIAHNHPSGAADPSELDRAMTRQAMEAGRLLGIDVLDHVIVAGESRYSSLKEMGVSA